VNHEVAHQWFGDYTTMRWFDDLWMKEGFATYMAAKMQAAMGVGDGTAWMSFYLRNKPTAYDVDASAGTTPVWQELANLDQAKSNYGAIVYNKAPGVLKQLNHLVGEPAFRGGVQTFLREHAYGNGTWEELLSAVGWAAKRDLTDWGRTYFVRPGMPVVEQQLEIRNGRIERLALIQHPAQPTLSGAGVWPMKVDVRLHVEGTVPVTLPVEMTAETTLVAGAKGLFAPNFVYANANDYGYGLFMLDEASRDWLLANGARLSSLGCRQVCDADATFLRAMLWGSLWDLVRDARVDPRRYVNTAVAALPTERDEQIAARLLGRIGRAIENYLRTAENAEDAEILRKAEVTFLRGATDALNTYGLRKSYFDAYVANARTPYALTHITSWLDSASAARMPLRQPTRWSIVTALIARGATNAEARLAAETARDTTTGGKRRAFIAAAAFPRAETKRAYFDRYFRDSTLNEDWVTASLGAFNASEQATLTLPYLRFALDTLPWVQKNRRIFFLGSWLNAFIGGQRSAEALAIVDKYLAEHPELSRDLRQKVLQVRDDLERTVRIRAAFVH
jgi:aminopeptidase N